jgi:DNA-binding beta-propeller fold protein YncE
MRHFLPVILGTLAAATFQPNAARAEILALVNYESNAEQATRKEGIAILDVDPASANFGKIVEDIALPADLHNHHIFFNKDASKAYLTALSAGKLMVFDPRNRPYELKTIAVPECEVGEDVVFSGDNTRWFLTCMGSNAVIVGDAVADKAIQTIRTSKPYPHGIARP